MKAYGFVLFPKYIFETESFTLSATLVRYIALLKLVVPSSIVSALNVFIASKLLFSFKPAFWSNASSSPLIVIWPAASTEPCKSSNEPFTKPNKSFVAAAISFVSPWSDQSNTAGFDIGVFVNIHKCLSKEFITFVPLNIEDCSVTPISCLA